MDEQTQQPSLSQRALTLLGSNAMQDILTSPPRFDFFVTGLNMALKQEGSMYKITDDQILGAYKNAYEAFPLDVNKHAKLTHFRD